jgi:perosamine synthetase
MADRSVIRLTVPAIDEADLAAVREVIASGFLVQGERVAGFESEVAEYVGVAHAVAVANCTAALHLALVAVGVRSGDAVAVTTYSWPATANVIALCGAEPAFVDIDAATLNMDPSALERMLENRKVAAVLPVHAFGGMADMSRIRAIADRYGVPVVEDAACALGATLDGRQAGSWGAAGCFSFHPRKTITTGEGGMITTDDPAIARRARILRNHGQDPDASAPDFVEPGYNLRLTEFQAALGSTQLAKFDSILAARRAAAAVYDQLLEGTVFVRPAWIPGSAHAYQSYVVLLPEGRHDRSEVLASLRARGIEATIGTYHMPLTTWARERCGHGTGDFPVTDSVAARALSLPLFQGISPAVQQRVVRELRALVEQEGVHV